MLIHAWDAAISDPGRRCPACHPHPLRRRRRHPAGPPGPAQQGLGGDRGAAKFKYDDHNPQEHRAQVAGRLEGRGTGRDRSAAAQQRKRLHEIGEWKPRR